MKSHKVRKYTIRVVEYLIAAFFAVINLIPVFWGVITSLKNPREISRIPPQIFGFEPTLMHYQTVLSGQFFRSIMNSVLFSLFAIGISAAETAVAIAIIINIYRNMRNIQVKNLNKMKW